MYKLIANIKGLFMKKNTIIALVAVVGALLAWKGYRQFMRAPQQQFTLIHRDAAFEVRSYPKTTFAEVTKTGTVREAVRKGFCALADYIFAKDGTHERIAMTSPVLFQPLGKSWTTRFVLPEEYTADTAPQPHNKGVRLTEERSRKVAVLTVDGAPEEKEWYAAARELRQKMKKAGYRGLDSAWYARYDAPWVPGFLRRNEVMITVE